MCDFRKINKIRLLGSREEIDVTDAPAIPAVEMKNITKEGFYHIIASGGFSIYYNGKKWLWEKNENPYYDDSKYREVGFEVIDFDDRDFHGNIIKEEPGDWDE